MNYIVLCMLLCVAALSVTAQNEDKPHCGISKEDIEKNKISTLIVENKHYAWGIYRKQYSWSRTYTFDTNGNIVKEDWVSLKSGKLDHSNHYTYDSHENLTGRKIVGDNLNVENRYYFSYNSKGLMDQYWTQPHTKLLFKYNEDGLPVNKLEVSPTDTSLEWNYVYENKLLVEEQYKIRALPTPFITRYIYQNNRLVFELKTHGIDTVGKIAYRYNAMGKMVEKIEIMRGGTKAENWSYDTLGQLIKFERKSDKDIETTEYLYDTNGLLISTKEKASFMPGVVDKSILHYPDMKKQ